MNSRVTNKILQRETNDVIKLKSLFSDFNFNTINKNFYKKKLFL